MLCFNFILIGQMFSSLSCPQCLWCGLGYFTLQEMFGFFFTEMEVVQYRGCLISSINQSNPQLEFIVSSLFVIRVVVLGDDVSENYWLDDLMLDFTPLPSGKIVLALNSLKELFIYAVCCIQVGCYNQGIPLSTSLKSVIDF